MFVYQLKKNTLGGFNGNNNNNNNNLYVGKINKTWHFNHVPKRLPTVSFLRPTRSTSHTPTMVNTKLVPEVAAVSQMACLSSRMPAICRMVAL